MNNHQEQDFDTLLEQDQQRAQETSGQLVVPQASAPVLYTLTTAEIDRQIATAKHWPRSLAQFKRQALSMATEDPEVAKTCFYSLKRKDSDGQVTFIQGPSIRLIEIAVSAYQNLSVYGRIVGEEKDYVVAQGICVDMQNNTKWIKEVRRNITTRSGQRYKPDMIQVTCNAAVSIACRNAAQACIPRNLILPIFEACKSVATGGLKAITERRSSMIHHFQEKHGVSQEQILTYLDKKGVEDIGITELEVMLGVNNALNEGETTVEAEFPKEIEKKKPVTFDELAATAMPPAEETKKRGRPRKEAS